MLLIDIGPADRTALAVESIGKSFSGIEQRGGGRLPGDAQFPVGH